METTVDSRPVFASTLPAVRPFSRYLSVPSRPASGSSAENRSKSGALATRHSQSVINRGVTRLRRLRPEPSAMAMFCRGSMSCGHKP